MEPRGLPPLAIPVLIAVGCAFVVVLSVNIGLFVIHMNQTKEHGKGSLLGRWAWPLSCAALLVPYIAPITLVMGGVDLARQRNNDLSRCHRRPARLALLNSAVALVCLTTILGVFVFGWTI